MSETNDLNWIHKPASPPPPSDGLGLERMMALIRRNWAIYIITVIGFVVAAFFYIRYTIPIYEIESTVLIEDELGTPGLDFVEGFAMRSENSNLDNQIMILSSYSMVRKTIEQLPFEIYCYRKGLFKNASYYPMDPIKIEPGPEGLPYNQEFIFEYQQLGKYRLKTSFSSKLKLDTIVFFGQSVQLAGGSFTIYPQLELNEIFSSGKKIFFKFMDKEQLTASYLNRLLVEKATREGTMVKLQVHGTNRVMDLMFLNKLVDEYIIGDLDKKNQEATRTIEFIESQLETVSDSLSITETQLQEFRSRNRVMDVSAQAQQIVDQAVTLENDKARLMLKRNYYHYLEDYLSQENSDEAVIAPASMGIEDPLLANLMHELAGLQAEYLSGGVRERNPLQAQLELRIKNTKESIKETLNGIKLANEMAITENDAQIEKLNAEASRLPVKERQLLGFERRFNLNNVLYTFLLQSRAEAQIRKASNTADHELIDQARSTDNISPDPKNSFVFAIALALMLPTIGLYLGQKLKTRITSEEDVKALSQYPIVAHLPHSRLSYNTVVFNEPSSRISEAFRNLRTRMEFFTQEIECPLILVTSSMPGEGKTFTSINLASMYSLAKKKTLLIGYDLRRPTLSKSFEMNGQAGLSNYLIGKSKLDEIIFKTNFDYLHLIPAGPIPPNPGELSNSEKNKELFRQLREKYDYIIVDSPPIGIVSDIYFVASTADVMLLVLKHGHTVKKVLGDTLTEIREFGLNHVSLIINDVKSKGNSYRYAYKYKYEYGEKGKKEKRPKVKKISAVSQVT